jgi:hypothetical protein
MTPSAGPPPAPVVRRPVGAALGMVSLAVHRLPAGQVRDRYEREFTAELYGMSGRCDKERPPGRPPTATAGRRATG